MTIDDKITCPFGGDYLMGPSFFKAIEDLKCLNQHLNDHLKQYQNDKMSMEKSRRFFDKLKKHSFDWDTFKVEMGRYHYEGAVEINGVQRLNYMAIFDRRLVVGCRRNEEVYRKLLFSEDTCANKRVMAFGFFMILLFI